MNTLNSTVEGPQLRCGWELEARPPKPNIFYLDLVSYPILLVTASIGSLLNFLVLGGEKPRTSKNVYLLVLAISDFLYMWEIFTNTYYFQQKFFSTSNDYLAFLRHTYRSFRWGGFLVYLKTASSDHSEDFQSFFTSLHGFCTFVSEMAAFTSDW